MLQIVSPLYRKEDLETRSASQNQEKSNTFLDNLEYNLETASLFDPLSTILIGACNAKCASWYNWTFETKIIDALIWPKSNRQSAN